MTWIGLTHTEEAVGSLGVEIGLGELGSIVTWGLGWWDDHLGLGESSELCGTGWQRHLLGGGVRSSQEDLHQGVGPWTGAGGREEGESRAQLPGPSLGWEPNALRM